MSKDEKKMITAEEMKGIIADGIAPVSKQLEGLSADISNVKKRTDFIEARVDSLEKTQSDDKEFATAAFRQFEKNLDALADEGRTERNMIKASLERIELWTETAGKRLETAETSRVSQQQQLDSHSTRFDKHAEDIGELREQQALTLRAVQKIDDTLTETRRTQTSNTAAIMRTEKNTQHIAEIAERLDSVRKASRYVVARGLSGGAGASLAYYVLQLLLSLINGGG